MRMDDPAGGSAGTPSPGELGGGEREHVADALAPEARSGEKQVTAQTVSSVLSSARDFQGTRVLSSRRGQEGRG